jgi:hypothetical protein
MEYNSLRPKMIIPEYGRNIQKMVEHAMTVEDREERNKIASAIISVMGQLNPQLRDIADFKHKLWDHLFIISNFKLDVDSPYPKPEPSILTEKPDKVDYPSNKIKVKHYGKIIEGIIDKAQTYEEGDEKQVLVASLANLMKRTYLNWNKDSVDDDVIRKDLLKLSGGKLTLPENFEFENTSDLISRVVPQRRKKKSNNGRTNNKQRRKY